MIKLVEEKHHAQTKAAWLVAESCQQSAQNLSAQSLWVLVALLFAGIVECLPLINLLLNLLELCLPKAIALVLCIVGVAVVLESLR